MLTPVKNIVEKNKMARKKKDEITEVWPKVTVGSHLTVKEYENGKTELIWDDEALTRDVHNAILRAESTIPVTTAKPKRKARV
jgi:hypothetical protein